MGKQTNENQQQKTPSENTENQNNQHQQPLTLLSPRTGTASSSPINNTLPSTNRGFEPHIGKKNYYFLGVVIRQSWVILILLKQSFCEVP
jgi:hypothetical protein